MDFEYGSKCEKLIISKNVGKTHPAVVIADSLLNLNVVKTLSCHRCHVISVSYLRPELCILNMGKKCAKVSEPLLNFS